MIATIANASERHDVDSRLPEPRSTNAASMQPRRFAGSRAGLGLAFGFYPAYVQADDPGKLEEDCDG
jgi:hypothetical protein